MGLLKLTKAKYCYKIMLHEQMFAILKKGKFDMDAEQRIYFCIDMKCFFASVECAERGLNPFETNLVVADESRGGGSICLAISPKMKALGVKNRCRIYEIPKNIYYLIL